MVAIFRVDQLGCDAHAVAGLADAALQNGFHAEFLADGAHVFIRAFKSKGGRPRGYFQGGFPGQCVEQLLGDAVAEILIFGVRAHIDEG